MHLAGSDEVSVTLRPAGYQFPDMVEGGRSGRNWLLIEGEIKTPDGAWTFREPCMLTAEAEGLAAWLAEASQGAVVASEPDAEGQVRPDSMFIEPNVGFSVEAYETDGVVMRVHFSLESAPSWAEEERRCVSHQFHVRCRMQFADVLAASRVCTAEIARFPRR